MLVRYRTTSALTLQNYKDDMNGIITGTITSASQLSAPAQANSVFYGSYPTGVYARVNGTSYTYSKIHNTHSTYVDYFRLTFDSTRLTTITLAQDYTSGTDTLLNTTAKTVNLSTLPYEAFYNTGIDIVINNKMLCIFAPSSVVSGGMIDIGHNGVSRAYTSNMLSCYFDFTSQPNLNIAAYLTLNPIFKSASGGTVPYAYNLDTLSYGSLTYGLTTTIPYKKTISFGGNTAVIENPVFIDSPNGAYASHLLYGVYRIPTNTFGTAVYGDSSGLYRYTYKDFSFLVD